MDGRNWHAIGNVSAANTANYGYHDHAPMLGTSFYRLKVLELSTAANYSQVRAVTLGKGGSVSAFPNPASHNLQINGLKGEHTEVSVYNAFGQQVMSGSYTTAMLNGEGLSISNLPNGNYVVRVVNNGAVETLRFIKS